VLSTDSRGWIDPFAIFHGNFSTFSFQDGHYEGHRWIEARTICFWLLAQAAPVAFDFALAKAGKSIPARIAMMAMTTSNSIKVKPQ